jgi:hypothetical protein
MYNIVEQKKDSDWKYKQILNSPATLSKIKIRLRGIGEISRKKLKSKKR